MMKNPEENMCGRYIPNTEDEITEIREILNEISGRISRIDYDLTNDRADVFPSTLNPVILERDNGVVVDELKWGFGKWDGKGTVINAKSETVKKSPFFSPHLNNRCVIPAHGYYEWQSGEGKTKIKYEFTSPGNKGLFMAGLFRGNEYVILTTRAKEQIRFIHDRMPLLMLPEQIYGWLRSDIAPERLGEYPNELIYGRSAG